MKLVRFAWKLLIGVKDALVLAAMLIFFGGVYALLSARPATTAIGEGALRLDLKGAIVEQPSQASFGQLLGGQRVPKQYRLRDVVAAIDAGAHDARVKAVALDLDGFTGGGQVALAEVGAALDRVRRGGKPVYAYALGYTDDSYQLAAHASQIWLDPMGLALFAGPGGSRPYFKGLIDKIGVNAHVYRVGKYKSYVEPYTRADQSPEARAENEALAAHLWDGWRAGVRAARPKARIDAYAANPEAVAAGSPDLARAALNNGIVDRLGSRAEWERMLAGKAGAGKRGLGYAHIALAPWIAANPAKQGDGAVGIVTVAGNIVDGEAGPGAAGGDSIARLIERAAAAGRIKALVLRVDSPGGSAIASERIRTALVAAKAKGLPVVVSMANVAASGGYWVATAGDRIFAEPATVTGSIGVFGIIPTFETALGKIGVTSDGVRTTPLSGQPDILGGTSPAFDAVVQKSIETTYARFIALVGAARHLPFARVNEIGQGRVWDGGTARQLGLVDQFGGLDDAVAEAARRAGLDPKVRHAVWVEKPKSWAETVVDGWADEDGDEAGADALSMLTRARIAALAGAVADARAMLDGAAVQARCLECPATGAPPVGGVRSLMAMLAAWLRA